MKHHPFNSDYLPNFEVLEEQKGAISLYPRTDQLPLLLRALQQEFNLFVAKKIARADERASDFIKIQRKFAVDIFCHLANSSRTDDLELFGLLDRNRVAQIAIVQRTKGHTPRGAIYRFKFYAGPQFFTEIYLSGRRLVFAEHTLERFAERPA